MDASIETTLLMKNLPNYTEKTNICKKRHTMNKILNDSQVSHRES